MYYCFAVQPFDDKKVINKLCYISHFKPKVTMTQKQEKIIFQLYYE